MIAIQKQLNMQRDSAQNYKAKTYNNKMIEILTSIAIFILTIVILVGFHEFGHFWVARRLGVKVLRFSIGFGKPLWSKKARDGTEYTLAWIPLGGYVKMLDAREGTVAEDEMKYEFNAQSLATRSAIVFAGPLFNFILAGFLYSIIFMIGTTEMRPIVGVVAPQSVVAEAGIQQGDEILTINRREVVSWEGAALSLLHHNPNQAMISIQLRRFDQSEYITQLDTSSINLLDGEARIEDYGFGRPVFPAIIGNILEASPAANSELQEGDRVFSFNGQAIKSWEALTQKIMRIPEQDATLGVRRDGEEQTVFIKVGSRQRDGKDIGYLGVGPKLDGLLTSVHHNPASALMMGVQKTGDMTILTLKFLYRLVTGSASTDNLGGPIAIAQVASASFVAGIVAYLGLLALLSISLGVLNLLPLPILDGGHLFYYLIEFVKGSPLSEKIQLYANQFGILAITCLTVFVFYNDIARLLLTK